MVREDVGAVARTVGRVVLEKVDEAVEQRWAEAVRRAARSSHLPLETRLSELGDAVAKELAATGALVGGVAAAPGPGTATAAATGLAEFGYFTVRMADLILTTAAIYGRTDAQVEERRSWVLAVLVFEGGAAKGFTRLMEQATRAEGGRPSSAMDSARLIAVNSKLARQLLARYAARRGVLRVARLLPLGVGAVVGGGGNYLAARATARHARGFFAELTAAD